MFSPAICVCPDGQVDVWPWADGEPVLTSAPRELVLRLLNGSALDRALAAAELTPEQARQLFRSHNVRERWGTLARTGRRARALGVVEVVRQAPHDERSLNWWFQGATRADADEQRRSFMRRWLSGPYRRPAAAG